MTALLWLAGITLTSFTTPMYTIWLLYLFIAPEKLAKDRSQGPEAGAAAYGPSCVRTIRKPTE
jgi:hypothetical protein